MGALHMDFRPAEVRVLAVGSTVAEGSMVEEEGTGEHQASDADNSTEARRQNDA